MQDLLRCRRGSAAFATVIALIPLIGVVALGAEAGSWYVIRQHAQNAADSAAYSGALRLACTLSGGSCDTTQTVDYRGKEFAAQNAFCATGDSTAYPGRACAASLPTDTSQAVRIEIGNYSGGTFTTTASGNAVRATVSQTQPGYLAAVMNLTTVTIPAQAIAQVQKLSDLCALSLGPDPNAGNGALKIGGSASNNGAGCGLMSDGRVQLASTPTFTGSGWALYGSTGCSPTNNCGDVANATTNYFMPPALDPLHKLQTEAFNTATISGSGNPCPGNGNCTINQNTITTAYSANLRANNGQTFNFQAPTGTKAYYFTGNLAVASGGTLTFQPGGTYIFANSTISFSGTVTGVGVTLVLLGNSSLTINGGNVDLSAPTTNAFSTDLNGVLIDDQATGSVSIGGNGVLKLGGTMYFPKTDVSFQGTTQPTNTDCTAIIAKTLTITGSAYLNSAGCNSNTIAHPQIVALVQ
jgi:Flp pilus assembly protein TadG